MSARSSVVLPLVVFCLVPGALRAQPPPLTLQAAVAEALDRNPELIALRAALDADRFLPARARALMPPMLEAQIWQWPINTAIPTRASYMVSAQQTIPGRGKRALRERHAQAGVDAASAEAAARAREIVAEVRRTYAELFVARQGVEITRERLTLLEQATEASQIRYAAGRTSQQDVLKALVEISRLHEEQLMLEERVRMAEARLNGLLARDTAAAIGAMVPPDETAPLLPVAALQELALERQPDLEVARAEIAQAEAAIAVADRERMPDFIIGGGYMFMGGERDAFTASVGISWPGAPWARKGIDIGRAEARSRLAAARARYNAEANTIRLAVQEAAIRAESAARRAALLRTSIVPQSVHVLDVSRVGYQADRADFRDILENQRILAEARLGYYRALAELEQARAELERAVGSPVVREAVSASLE